MTILLFLGNTDFDSRSQKFIEALSTSNIFFHIVDLKKNDSPFLINFINLTIHFFKVIIKQPVTNIICMDVFSLPITLSAFFLRSIPFHFDAREINAEVFAFKQNKLKQGVWLFFEWLGFLFSNSVTTVNQSLQTFFKSQYHKTATIILNFPHRLDYTKTDLIHSHFHLDKKYFLWIFQGGIQQGRGFETAIEFISHRPDNEKLVVIGKNKLSGSDKIKIPENNSILFTGEISNKQLLSWTASGDAGLIFIDDSVRSYKYSLPNKFFEYIFAEIPILTFDLPEITNFVQRFDCGITTTKINLHASANKMQSHFEFYKNGSIQLKNELLKNDQIQTIKKILSNNEF